jgi:subtilisin-like proprotein convertase family protein
MRRKPLFWFLLCLLCLGGAVYFWRLGDRWEAEKAGTPPSASAPQSSPAAPSTPHALAPAVKQPAQNAARPADPRYPYRLSNTGQPMDDLLHNDRAVLLANALIDTGKSWDRAAIPPGLRAPAVNGSYIVQSRGPVNDQFRAALRNANATIVAYIPNDAFLVRVSDAGAQQLAADSAQTQSVLPFEPYYKLDAPLLKQAIEEPDGRAPGAGLKVVVFGDAYQATLQGLQALGAEVTGADNSPFGPVLTVHPPRGMLAAVAGLPGVQQVSVASARAFANDLVRPRLGVTVDSVTPTNYLGLTGSNVLLNINDSGVDSTHPDFSNHNFLSDSTNALFDSNGHGTHVAGTILGNGSQSATVTNQQPGSVTNANFRGIATNANAFVMTLDHSDGYLQQVASQAGVFISNDSWNYGDSSYDIAAASYDAAVRDAQPGVTGPQPLLFVFSAGNNGGGTDDGLTANADTILSPATAKNVITVGAIDQYRNIIVTNTVPAGDGTTNTVSTTNTLFLGPTDNSNLVWASSSRGNVGINVEGSFGRFKPDLVSPGTFVISTRSTTWDTAAYYNPTNSNSSTFANENVQTNSLDGLPAVFIPDNAVGLSITISSNQLSPYPFPALIIYAKSNTPPTFTVFDETNSGTLTLPASALIPGTSVYFSVGNSSDIQAVSFDATITLTTTNDNGYFLSLSNLNNGVAPWYRYETGTSMAAAGISGMLACMQEFFQSLNMTNSPALMKALLINGARPQPAYDLEVQTPLNSQGWGLANIINTMPPALTNLTASNLSTMPVQFFDQSPTNALATGQSFTWNLSLTSDAQAQDLRVTLVWTDPPGNPIAGVKLVNDLDLIVTNLDTGEVFYGNDIPQGSDFNESTDPEGVPNIDSVNNVENVFLQAPLGTNYSITVLGSRVNVNAVTANTNGIAQDYALVISSGDAGAVSSPFTLTNANNGLISTNNPSVTNVFFITNGVPLFNQRVGANSQYSGSTNGTAAQWNFYIYTNMPPTNAADPGNFTNVAFLTFAPPNLSLPRVGALNEVSPPDTNATRYTGADVDLYVSADPALTNLDTNVIANAFKSTARDGTQTVLITNSSPGQVYYIGVKAEDQNGGQFALFGASTDKSFGLSDPNGNAIVTILTPFPLQIPGGSPAQPNHALVIGVTASPIVIRKAVVTNSVEHQEFGDLIGTLTHNQQSAVLNNHSFFANPADTNETLVYDDSGENDIPGSRPSDGPGTLQNFTGQSAAGQWMFTMVNDSSLTDTGQINNFVVALQAHQTSTIFSNTLQPESSFFDFVDVPASATNLTITITEGNFTQALDLYVKKGSFPSATNFDDLAVIQPPVGGSLSINKFSSPVLNAGRYFYEIFNPSTSAQTVVVTVEVDQSLTPVGSEMFSSGGSQPLLDDAVTYSTNQVGIASTVVSAEVGVRIVHPRESDLVLTLISPQGTRVLLAENRGGLDTNGYGSGIDITNVLPQTVSGVAQTETNIINTATNFGTLVIDYNMYTIPDWLRVIYDGQDIFDSGLISYTGEFSINFGPGTSSSIEIEMNPPGTNPATNGDLWTYTASVITQEISYATFTENTNLTTTPIKFATPPFGAGAPFIPPQTNFISSFESVPATNYAAGSTIEGWTVLGLTSNSPASVVTVTALADTGSNVLALHGSAITRTFTTIPGQNYTLSFVNHGRPSLTPVSWWKAEGNFGDSADGNSGTDLGGVTFAPGVVGQAFNFNGGQQVQVADAPNLMLTNAVTVEGWVLTHSSSTGTIVQRGDNRAGFDPYDLGVGPPTTGGQCDLQWEIEADDGTASVLLGPMDLNVFTHVAGTYSFDGTNSHQFLYINGQLVSSNQSTIQPIGVLTAHYPGVAIGGIDGPPYDYYFNGLIDEITIHSNGLSTIQVQDIYAAGSAGKDPVGLTPQVSATVVYGGQTNTILGTDQWTTNVYSFTAPTNSMTLTITPDLNDDGFGNQVRDGMLLDSFRLIQDAAPNPTNYYLPEESLDKLVGERSQGDWLLEVLDNRAGATNNSPTLVSWQLNLVLADTVPAAIPITDAVTQSNTVPPASIVYFQVNVPPWALYATNILVSSNGANLTLLFNQNILPTGTNATDFTLLTTTGTASQTINTSNGPPALPLLVPGQRYFLGVQNLSTNMQASFSLQVDFNLTPLTNAVPYSNSIAAGNIPRYFFFDQDSNGVETLFQIVSTSGNLDLVVNQTAPLPDTVNFDFQTSGTSFPQNIFIPTNAYPEAFPTPMPLPFLPTNRWYLGVFNNDTSNVSYTIMATEVGQPNIISLSNGVPFTFRSAPPGPDLTNFYLFSITNTVPSVLFELYNLTVNDDLTLDPGAIPYGAPFFASSTQPGTKPEQIVLRTNGLATQIYANLATNWYLGVPNNGAGGHRYTIRATLPANGLLIGSQTIELTPVISTSDGLNYLTLTWPSVLGEYYDVQTSPDLVTWTTVTVPAIQASGTTTSYTGLNPINGVLFYRVIQVPGP